MKIQCNVCEAAEAKVLCCADDAALCWDCDEKVHAANKVAGKHHRVQLVPASRVPKCDICQEASGYFFCLEDRALLCRSCDVAIHTNNPYVSAHRRFLISGVQVGLEHAEPVSSVAKEQSNSTGRVVESLANGSSSLPFSGESNNEGYSDQAIKNGYAGGSMGGNLTDWPLDDLFGFTDYNQNFGSPKADSGKLGSSEGSPPYFPADEALDMDECFGQVPEMSYNAPEIPSPPTASGLHWQRISHYHNNVDHAASVPDIYSSVKCGTRNLN